MTTGKTVSFWQVLLLCLFCLAGLASAPGVAEAQQENTTASASGGMSPEEWLTNEVQALALDRHDILNRSMVPDRPQAEISLRKLEAGEPPEQVAEDARSLREALQRACGYAIPLASAVAAGFVCTGTAMLLGAPGHLPMVAATFCGALAAGMANEVCSAAERRLGLEIRPTRDLVRGFKRAEGGDRVWDEGGFSESTRVYLEDDVEGVIDEHPQLRRILSDHEPYLYDREARQQWSLDGKERVESLLADVVNGIDLSGDSSPGSEGAESESAGSEGAESEGAENRSAEFWVFREAVENPSRERLRQRIDMVNARTALAGAVALIGVAGPEAQDFGRKTLAVADAALGVQGAVHAFEAATAMEIGASTSLAHLALSGSLVNIGVSLIGSLIDTGPTADQIIIEEIGKLREQVEEFRVEMHERFDGVHEHLDRVVEQLEEGFDRLSEDIEDVRVELEAVQRRLRNLGENVDQVARSLTYTYVNETRQHDQLMDAVLGQLANECRDTDLSEQDMDRRLLNRCRSYFQGLAALVAGDQVSLTPLVSEDNDPFLSDAVLHPDRTVNASLREFKRYLESAGRTSDRLPPAVVGPEAWLEVMIKQNESRTLFLNAAERLGVEQLASYEFKSVMDGHRSDLRGFLQAVEEELRVFTGIDEPRETVFSALFGEVRARLGRLRDLIGSIQDDYYEDDSLFDGRTRSAEVEGAVIPEFDGRTRSAEVEGAVIPEIRYEDHPHAWNRMADFYSSDPSDPSDLYPGWLTLRREAECREEMEELRNGAVPTYIWSPVTVGSDEWFQGDGILQFLHGNDLMPVRLGIGNIEVCDMVGGTRDFGNSFDSKIDALALAIWYTPGADTECPRTLLLHEVAGLESEASEAHSWSIASLMLKIESRVRGRWPVLIGRENASSEASACVEGLYNERFEAKRQALSDYVRSRLEDDAEFAEISRALMIAHLHLRSWLALALDDARWRSEVVEEVLSRAAAFPDLTELIGTQGQGYAWDIVDDGLGRVERIEELLSSRRMRDAVLYGAGHRYLTKAHFVVLDGPADEIGLANR